MIRPASPLLAYDCPAASRRVAAFGASSLASSWAGPVCSIFGDLRRLGAPGAGCEDGDQPDKQDGEHRWGTLVYSACSGTGVD